MYNAHVISIRERQCAIRLAPEQPDRMPYYLSANFAAATLWWAGGELASEHGDDNFSDDMAAGRLDGSSFVESVLITNLHGFPWTYQSDATAADYIITATDERWIAGIALGHQYENYARCDNGAYLSPMRPDEHGRPMQWWFPGDKAVRPRDVLRDLDVLQALSEAGVT